MMFSSTNPSMEKRFNRVFLFLFICLFILAPVYYQDNPGGEGLFVPFNNTVWIAACFLIGLGLLKVVHTRSLVLPSIGLPMLLFAAWVTLMGVLMSTALPVSWLFRSLSIWGGVLMFFSLNQFRLERRWQDNLLLVVVASGLVQSLIGLAHLIMPNSLGGFIPTSTGLPRGIFQQVNVNASYTATTLIAGIYCLSLPSIRRRPLALRWLILISIGMNALIIATSGSRLALLASAVGLAVLLTARYRQLWRRRGTSLTALACILLAFALSPLVSPENGGLHQGLAKLEKITQTSTDPTRNDVRWMMYTSSLELIRDKPWLGYGIGRFQAVWHDKKASYLKEHPEAAILVTRLSHPHNELLYWGIEGGLVALSAILLVTGALLYRLWQLGWQRGGAYLALLLPITLHTQVELPLYISQLHWLLLVTLMALISSHRRRLWQFPLSTFGRTSGLTLAMLIPVLATIYFTHSLLAGKATMDFQLARTNDVSKLDFPSRNIYFTDRSAFLRMQTLLRYGLRTGDRNALQVYTPWARKWLINIPEAAVFVGLALAQHLLGNYDEAYRVMARNLAIYPEGEITEIGKQSLNDLDHKLGRQPYYTEATTQH